MILGVAPGFSGQKFLPSTINKVKALRKMDRKIIIEVDGGVSDKNIVKLKKAGANLFCLGSYLSGEEMPENLKLLKKMIK